MNGLNIKFQHESKLINRKWIWESGTKEIRTRSGACCAGFQAIVFHSKPTLLDSASRHWGRDSENFPSALSADPCWALSIYCKTRRGRMSYFSFYSFQHWQLVPITASLVTKFLYALIMGPLRHTSASRDVLLLQMSESQFWRVSKSSTGGTSKIRTLSSQSQLHGDIPLSFGF